TLFYLGAAGAFVTAFYVFRMIFYTFTGSLRSHTAHPHESPQVMTVPLIVLAAFSGVIGLVGAPWPLVGNMFHRFVHFEAADGAVNLVGWLAKAAGGRLRHVQTGRAQNYLLVIALGVIVLAVIGLTR